MTQNALRNKNRVITGIVTSNGSAINNLEGLPRVKSNLLFT